MINPGIDACLQEISGGLYDIQISSAGDILTVDAFDTAIIVSLLSDRRANQSEVATAHLRRGWIGNERTPGIEMGSKIWLYEQSRLTRSVLNGVTDAASQALNWLVEQGYADRIESVETFATAFGMRLEAVIRRPNSEVEKRFFELWQNTALPCIDEPNYIEVVIDPTATGSDQGKDIFELAGRPTKSVDVHVLLTGVLTGQPALSTGLGWHPESVITIELSALGVLLGDGGPGGKGEGVSPGGYGGGGGGGAAFGTGGSADDPAGDGTDAGLVLFGSGGAGFPTGGAVTDAAAAGTQGFWALEIFHPVTIKNSGLIIAGGGGGGGGGENQSGGNGGLAGNAGVAGGGGAAGGAIGDAVHTNGFEVTWNPMGVVTGAVT